MLFDLVCFYFLDLMGVDGNNIFHMSQIISGRLRIELEPLEPNRSELEPV